MSTSPSTRSAGPNVSQSADAAIAPPPAGRRRWPLAILLTALLGLYAFQLWLHVTRTSATYDEPVHILAGQRHLQCGDYGINPEHPPLLKMLAALPLAAEDVVEPSWPCGSKVTPKYDGWVAGADFLAESGVDRVLLPARAAASLMSLLLAALVLSAAWEMFGPAEAVVALALLAFEPNLIAHGSLVTTDMALTATLFGAVYALYRYRRRPGVWRLLTAGAGVGLMLASKHSGILMLPVLYLLLLADALLASRGEAEADTRLGRKLLRDAAAYALIILIGFTTLWASYGFRYHALPDSAEKAFSVPEYLASGPRPDTANTLPGKAVQLLDRARILPEAYTYGLADIAVVNETYMFLLGTVYPTGRWFYFPVAFTIKSSIPLLLLLPLGLLTRRLYRGRPRAALFLLLPPVAFFAFALTAGLNIGVRHILPVYPFFIVVAAVGACALARRRRAFAVAVAALLLFHAFTAARTAPHYIAFGNDLWGGTDNTHRLLSDSNVDWGQNLKLVKDYLEKEGSPDCWIAYFGPAGLAHLYTPCRPMPVSGWAITSRDIQPIPPVIDGLILISTEAMPPLDTHFEPLAKVEPVTLLGGGIKVYRGRFELPLAAALSHIGRGRQFLIAGSVDEALAEAREAVRLAPEHPRIHLFLGGWLVGAGRKDEARQEFETTIRLAQPHGDAFQFEADRARQRLLEVK